MLCSSGGSSRCLEVGSLILGGELGPQSPRQGQQTRPSAECQAGMGQPRWVRAHWQALGVLGEVLGLELLLQRGTEEETEKREATEDRSTGDLNASEDVAQRNVIDKQTGRRKDRELSAAMCTRGEWHKRKALRLNQCDKLTQLQLLF